MPLELQKARELFLHAVGNLPPERWEEYVAKGCGGDSKLKRQVSHLLQVHREAGSFLESPAVALGDAGHDRTSAEPPTANPEGSTVAPPGTMIGPYKLLQPIGEGGMGTVYMAEQTQPVRRIVALKLIKAGMDSRQVLARFGAERQALALMDHPNIAKVFDAGAANTNSKSGISNPNEKQVAEANPGSDFGLGASDFSTGRPYFVMELVKGIPITKFCDERRLTLRERLELAIPVCQAVQHAHQKGIIHRDLKPSNVLIALYDGKPVPKIIDFGVAKATGPRLTDETLYTEFGAVVGTLEYMSPEQAELNQLDIDTRSDIYSLGVLIYELLTGSTPLERKRLKSVLFLEVLRLIREEESPRPSRRLSTTDELPSIAACRHIEPTKLRGLVRGELDWIVMKALEKDRNHRYETANDLAADLRHYLDDEPVKACPPSAAYRLRKMVRRNKGLLTMLAVVFLALIAGTAVATWQAIRTTHAERLARNRLQAEIKAQNATLAQLHLTEAAEDQAMHRLYDARLAQARAGSLSRRMGQRFESLDAVAQALKIARDLNLTEERLLELRNAAIACLALPDLKIAQEWNGWSTDSYRVSFDTALERYARVDRQGVVHVHRVAGGSEICRLAGFRPGEGGGGPWFSPDGQFLALHHEGRRLKLWKLAIPEPIVVMDEVDAPAGAAFSPDSRRIAIGHADGSIRLRELPSGRELTRMEAVSGARALVFHPAGGQLAVLCTNDIRVYDLNSGKMLAIIPQPQGAQCPTWHPDGKELAVGCVDRIIHIWDMTTLKSSTRMEGHKLDGVWFAYDHAGDLLASTSWDTTIRLWDPRTGQQLFTSPGGVVSLRFSPDDRFLAAEASDTKLRIWEVARPNAYRSLVSDPLLGQPLHHTGCAISPDGRLIAITHEAGVSFWDLRRRKQIAFTPIGLSRSPVFESCDALLTGGPTDLLRWPVQEVVGETGRLRIGPPTRLLPFRGDVIGSSSGGRVVSSPQRAGALVLDQDHPDRPIPLSPHADVRSTAVSPDGRWAATGSHWYTKVKIWEARTGKLVRELPVETGSTVGFSPDGKWLATTGGGLALWAVGSWKPGTRIGGGAFAFSPDSQLLAVETGHGAIRLVSPDSGQEYARLKDPNQDRARQICFSPDGSQLVAPTADSVSTHVWYLRAIREQLSKMGLDWDMPPYPPVPKVDETQPLLVQVQFGGRAVLPRDPEQAARQSIEQARRAVKANPNDPLACNNLAWAYLTAPAALRDWKAALPLAQKAVRLEPGPMYRNTLGLAYYRAGRYREAIEAFQANLKGQVDWCLTYDLYFLAMSHQKLGESAFARQFYDVAVRWSADHGDALKPFAVELAAIQAEAAELLGVKEKND